MAAGTRIPFSGVMLIVVGAVFLADQFHVIHFGQFFHDWWPAILVIAGVLNLIEKPAAPFGPLILITVGVALLLAKRHVVQMSSVWQLWPVVLIALGLNILLSRGSKG
jgi:cadmium resistance protein CadD (predicted permease)